MKHIKLFDNFYNLWANDANVNNTIIELKLKQQLRNLKKELYRNNIKNYTINDDGTIDVDDDVIIEAEYDKIPFKFGKVTGDFKCSFINLKSLEGSPYYVGGDYNIAGNGLESLEGSPSEVGGDFNASYNKLKSLKGMPLEIGGCFNVYVNPTLKELDSISNIEGAIFCDDSVDISKFEGYCKKILQ